MKVYGLPNCGTTKAAINWLRHHNADFVFHDVKKEGIEVAELNAFLKQVPFEKLLNRKSTTWRALTTEEQASANNETGAKKLMQQNTSLIKRPVVKWPNGDITTGWDEELFIQKLKS